MAHSARDLKLKFFYETPLLALPAASKNNEDSFPFFILLLKAFTKMELCNSALKILASLHIKHFVDFRAISLGRVGYDQDY